MFWCISVSTNAAFFKFGEKQILDFIAWNFTKLYMEGTYQKGDWYNLRIHSSLGALLYCFSIYLSIYIYIYIYTYYLLHELCISNKTAQKLIL